MQTDSVQLVFASQGAGHLVALRADRGGSELSRPRFAAFKPCDAARFSERAVAAAESMPGTVVDARGVPCAVNAYGICVPVPAFAADLASMSGALAALAETDPQGAFDVACAASRGARRVPWRFDTPDAWREVALYGSAGR